MKRILLSFTIIFLQLSSHAQYQVQKGHWIISHIVGGYGFSKYDYKEYEDGVLDYHSTTKESAFRLGFSGPDWGTVSTGTKKSKDEGSEFESKVSATEIWLQPQAGYFVSNNLMIGASLLIGTSSEKYRYSNVYSKDTYSAIGIGPVVRYYFGKSTKHKPFAGFESRIDFTKSKERSEYGGMSTELSEKKETGDLFMVKPYVGYGWFLGKRWTAEVRIDYTYVKEKGKQTAWEYEDGTLESGFPRYENYVYTTNSLSLSIGISYTF